MKHAVNLAVLATFIISGLDFASTTSGTPINDDRIQDFTTSPSQQLYDLMAPSFSRSLSAGHRHHRRITLEHLLEHQSKPEADTCAPGVTNHDLQVITPVGQQQQVTCSQRHLLNGRTICMFPQVIYDKQL